MKKKGEDILMRDKDILKAAIASRGTSQVKVAALIGIRQNALSASINRERMSMDSFTRILNELGYAVAVVDKQSGEVCWVVDGEK